MHRRVQIRLIPATPAHLSPPLPALAQGLARFYPSVAEGLAYLAEVMAIMGAKPRPDPWADWWALSDCGAFAGLCGFKAAPDAEGAVEIGYGSFPLAEGRGVATAMAAGLVAIAAAHGARLVKAHTLPVENASATVLRRNGFVTTGTVIDPEDGEVWAWQRPIG